jgi:hypothetical protein
MITFETPEELWDRFSSIFVNRDRVENKLWCDWVGRIIASRDEKFLPFIFLDVFSESFLKDQLYIHDF